MKQFEIFTNDVNLSTHKKLCGGLKQQVLPPKKNHFFYPFTVESSGNKILWCNTTYTQLVGKDWTKAFVSFEAFLKY